MPLLHSTLKNIKLFLTDIDGVLTDGGMYYHTTDIANEAIRLEGKRFDTRDAKGMQILRDMGVPVGMVTSEDTKIVEWRGEKLKLNYLFQGKEHGGKLDVAKAICKELNITLDEVAYIGDDINCKELLSAVGVAACPKDAVQDIHLLPGIIRLQNKGGHQAVREYVDMIIRAKNA